MKKVTNMDLMGVLEMLEEILEIAEQYEKHEKYEKAVAKREMPVTFFEEFEVEDLVMVHGEHLGMIIAIDKNDHVALPYLVRVGNENCWLAEEEIELADIDSMLQEGEKELDFIDGFKGLYTYHN